MARSKTSTHSARRAARPALNGAACGCNPGAGSVAGQTRDGVGPGAHAVGVDAAIKAANLKHLRRIEGQVRGLQQMIENERDCLDVTHQISATINALRRVQVDMLQKHLAALGEKVMDGTLTSSERRSVAEEIAKHLRKLT